jgi:hypothetical protein
VGTTGILGWSKVIMKIAFWQGDMGQLSWPQEEHSAIHCGYNHIKPFSGYKMAGLQ